MTVKYFLIQCMDMQMNIILCYSKCNKANVGEFHKEICHVYMFK